MVPMKEGSEKSHEDSFKGISRGSLKGSLRVPLWDLERI